MPKNAKSIMRYSVTTELIPLFDVHINNLRDYYGNTDVRLFSYHFNFGESKIVFQYLPINYVVCAIFDKTDDEQPSFIYPLAGINYHQKKAKMESVTKIIVDAAKLGHDIKNVKDSIKRI